MSENIVDDDNQIDYSSLNKGFVQSSIGRQNDQITKVTDIKLSKLNINDLLTQSCMMDSIIT
jgi:hypothetical protein